MIKGVSTSISLQECQLALVFSKMNAIYKTEFIIQKTIFAYLCDIAVLNMSLNLCVPYFFHLIAFSRFRLHLHVSDLPS